MQVIQIPLSENCYQCPCMEQASSADGGGFFICKAFSRVLEVKQTAPKKVSEIFRCEECKKAEQEVEDE